MGIDRDALQVRLRALFLDELDEHVLVLNRSLLELEQWSGGPGRGEVVNAMFRSAHSLKGAAHAAAVAPVATLCHGLESALARLRDDQAVPHGPPLDALFRAVDVLAGAARQLRDTGDVGELPVTEVVRSLAAEWGDQRDRPPSPPPASPPASVDTEARTGGGEPAGVGSVRIPAARLEELLDRAGEVLLACERMHLVAVEAMAASDTVSLRKAAWAASAPRRASRDGRGLDEVAAGAVVEAWDDAAGRLAHLAAAAASADRTLNVASRALADGIRHARMSPFSMASEGLDRVVRDVARAAGKEVRLTVRGGDVAVDRAILHALREPLLHLVRNAVDHGIEPPSIRAAAGKPTAGRVTVEAALEGGGVALTVADDGGGIDVAAVKAAAAARGMGSVDDDVVGELVFAPGLSTARLVTEVSGRGVGLDAVRAGVEALGGSVAVESEPGQGTRVKLLLPLTLSVIRALLVSSGEALFALPSSGVRRLVRVGADDLKQVDGRSMVLLDDRPLPITWLADALPGVGVDPAATAFVDGVVVEAPGGEAVIAVDALVAEQEVVMKRATPRVAGVPGVLGATILPGGEVALVLNPATVVRVGAERSTARARREAEPGPGRPRRVLLVDDTLTTRALERSILEAAGYEVVVAVDGVEAWELLQAGDHGVEAVVSDVNMPRMDGLALCRAVRASSHLRHVPFVLVTSLADHEDRQRGVEAGADAYIAKGEFDQSALLDALERLL